MTGMFEPQYFSVVAPTKVLVEPIFDTGGMVVNIAAFKSETNTWADAIAEATAVSTAQGGTPLYYPPGSAADAPKITGLTSAGGVTSWDSRTGAVTPQAGDYTAAEVTNAADTSSASTQTFTGDVEAPALIASGLTGATAASRYVGATPIGPPATGTFVQGDFVIDQSGAIYVCTTGGSPGLWVRTGPGGSAGGDLSGSYPSPTVAKIQGTAVSSTAPTTSQVLIYNGTDWTPETQVFDVKAYGAKGDGTTDDTTAINDAISACVTAGGGTVYFPAGTYLTSTGISVPNTQTGVYLCGAGEASTVVKASSSAFSATAVCVHQANGWIMDMTFDGNGATTEALEFSNPSGQSTFTLTQGACRVTARNALGSWIMVVWDRNQTYQIDRFSFVNVTVKGPGNTAGDNFAVSYVNRCSVTDITFSGLERTPNFYYIKQLTADGIFSDGGANTGSIVFDAGVAVATVNNMQVVAASGREVPVWVNCPLALFTNCVLSSGVQWDLNPTGTAGTPVVRLVNCDSGFGINIANPLAELSVIGGRLVHPSAAGDSAIVDASPASSTTGYVRVTDVLMDGGNGTTTVFRSSNVVTWTLLEVTGGHAENFASLPTTIVTNITLGAGSYTRSLVGVNPVGVVTVTVPSSGTAVAAEPYDRTFYVTTASGTTSCTLAVQNGPTVTAIASTAQVLTVFVPAGKTLTPTYAGTAPTWVVEGL